MLVVALLSYRLARRRLGGYLGHALLALIAVCVLLNALSSNGLFSPALSVLFVVVVAGTMLYGARGSLAYGALAWAVIIAVGLAHLALTIPGEPDGRWATQLMVAVLYLATLAIVVLLARLIEASLYQALLRGETQTAALQEANTALAEQSAELRQTRDQLEEIVLRQQADLTEATAAQSELEAAVQAISTPVVPLIDGVIVLVLVGEIDQARAAQFTDALLQGIERGSAQIALIDITGVPTVDSGVAAALLDAAAAARLLGAEVLIVGITPQVAQTLVALDVDFDHVTTASDLQAGINLALRRRNLVLQPINAGAASLAVR